MTTTLDILNSVLTVLGEDPVSDESSTLPTAQNIMRELHKIDRETQARGWWFNTEYNLLVNPDLAGNIILPGDTLRLDTKLTETAVKRGGKMYDPVNHTYVFTSGITFPELVLKLTLEDTPTEYSTYIGYALAYQFYVNDDGDETKASRLEKNKFVAWAELIKEDINQKKINVVTKPSVALLLASNAQVGGSYNTTYPGGRAL